MLRWHLGLPVYDDYRPVICAHYNRAMDTLDKHLADLGPAGFGRLHRYNSLHIVFAY